MIIIIIIVIKRVIKNNKNTKKRSKIFTFKKHVLSHENRLLYYVLLIFGREIHLSVNRP